MDDEKGDQPITNCPVRKHPDQNSQIDLPGNVMMYIPYSFKLTTIMLTLDPTTLFYWTLSDPPPKKIKLSMVESWAKSIPPSTKPVTGPATVKTGKSSANHRSSTAPALTSASSHVTSSILTSAITITTQDPIKIKQDPGQIYTYDGGLSDHKETVGIECEVAHASPIKGKRRLNSEVSIFCMNSCNSCLDSKPGTCD